MRAQKIKSGTSIAGLWIEKATMDDTGKMFAGGARGVDSNNRMGHPNIQMSFLIVRFVRPGFTILIPEEPNEARKLIANRFRHQAIVARRPVDTDLPCTLDDRDLQLSDFFRLNIYFCDSARWQTPQSALPRFRRRLHSSKSAIADLCSLRFVEWLSIWRPAQLHPRGSATEERPARSE